MEKDLSESDRLQALRAPSLRELNLPLVVRLQKLISEQKADKPEATVSAVVEELVPPGGMGGEDNIELTAPSGGMDDEDNTGLAAPPGGMDDVGSTGLKAPPGGMDDVGSTGLKAPPCGMDNVDSTGLATSGMSMDDMNMSPALVASPCQLNTASVASLTLLNTPVVASPSQLDTALVASPFQLDTALVASPFLLNTPVVASSSVLTSARGQEAIDGLITDTPHRGHVVTTATVDMAARTLGSEMDKPGVTIVTCTGMTGNHGNTAGGTDTVTLPRPATGSPQTGTSDCHDHDRNNWAVSSFGQECVTKSPKQPEDQEPPQTVPEVPEPEPQTVQVRAKRNYKKSRRRGIKPKVCKSVGEKVAEDIPAMVSVSCCQVDTGHVEVACTAPGDSCQQVLAGTATEQTSNPREQQPPDTHDQHDTGQPHFSPDELADLKLPFDDDVEAEKVALCRAQPESSESLTNLKLPLDVEADCTKTPLCEDKSFDSSIDLKLPFDDEEDSLKPAPAKSGRSRGRRGRRASAADLEVISAVAALQSPDTSLEGLVDLPALTPNCRRSRRLRRKSIELCKVAMEHRKQMQQRQLALDDTPDGSESSLPASPAQDESAESPLHESALPSLSPSLVTTPEDPVDSSWDVDKNGNMFVGLKVHPKHTNHPTCMPAIACGEHVAPPGGAGTQDTIAPPGEAGTRDTVAPPGEVGPQATVAPPGEVGTQDTVAPPSEVGTQDTVAPPSEVAATKSSASPGGATAETETPASSVHTRPRRKRVSSAAAVMAAASTVSPAAKTRGKRKRETSIEDIYLNKLWKSQMPQQKTWETIYEQPQVGRRGKGEELVSAKRFKRMVDFDSQHSQARMKRRRQKAMKCGWRPATKKKRDQLGKLLDARLESLAASDLESTATHGGNSCSEVDNDDIFYTPGKSLQCSTQPALSCVSVPQGAGDDVFETPLKMSCDRADTLNSSGESTDSGIKSVTSDPTVHQVV